MRDRLPTPGKENRVKITQDDGTVVAGVLEYDDQATQEGSPYTKGNVLPDDVCTAYGIDTETSEPKDAFLAIPGIMGKCILLITVKKINGAPYPGVLVNGLANIDTPRRTTNQNGQVAVYVDAGTYNLSFVPNPVCVDTEIPSRSVSLTAGGSSTVTTQEQSNGLTSLSITSTRTVAFSANVRSIDAFCVGGGGAGGNGYDVSGATGGGGGGGRTKTGKITNFERYQVLQAVVGAGGVGRSTGGTTGGTTSILNVSASGGNPGEDAEKTPSSIYGKGGDGGSGGGGGGSQNGGNGGSDGEAGSAGLGTGGGAQGGDGQGTTTRAFGETSGQLFAGGGGGGGRNLVDNGGDGGGGRGAWGNSAAVAGTPNTGGGGGGGGQNKVSNNIVGANGGSGIIMLRW